MIDEPTDLPRCAASPCGSCPYRKDVPSGLWDASEYEKLLRYDGETWQQSPALFHCHQLDGHLCAGWVACHDHDHLLAFRMQAVDPSVYEYKSPVEIFSSGREAAAHGMAAIDEPGEDAVRLIRKLSRRQARQRAKGAVNGHSKDRRRSGGSSRPA